MDEEGGVEEVMNFCLKAGGIERFNANKPNLTDCQEQILYAFFELSQERRTDSVITRSEIINYCKIMPTPLPVDLMFDVIKPVDLHYLKTKAEIHREKMQRKQHG